MYESRFVDLTTQELRAAAEKQQPGSETDLEMSVELRFRGAVDYLERVGYEVQPKGGR